MSEITQVRLFPLPNLVLFPQALQPLHIFEPRYRQMTTDALAGDRLIAMVLPMPGWEADYAGNPALQSIATVGRIIAEQPLEDGRYNILLRGQARIRIIEEIPTNHLYRTARVETLHDMPPGEVSQAASWRKKLVRKAVSWCADQDEVVKEFYNLQDSDLPLGALCDIIAFALPLPVEFKQELLEELEVSVRVQLLYDFLQAKAAAISDAPRPFPPEFSAN